MELLQLSNVSRLGLDVKEEAGAEAGTAGGQVGNLWICEGLPGCHPPPKKTGGANDWGRSWHHHHDVCIDILIE